MWPFEFSATPSASPRFMVGGYFRKLGTDTKGISGASRVWAPAGAAPRASATAAATMMKRLTRTSLQPGPSDRKNSLRTCERP